MLSGPGRGIGPTMKPLIEGMTFVEPGEVIELADGDVIELAGMSFDVDHTPGHTQGSVVFRTRVGHRERPGRDGPHRRHAVPGFDRPQRPARRQPRQLLQSIADKLLILADDTAVLPGHGGSSTVGPNVGPTRFSLDSPDRNKEK